ncbi:MAG: hypothetical protein IPO87_02080 [Flavobacteriales bacterium]|nr:hypothetical protein [Flavobacteriales bacterium]
MDEWSSEQFTAGIRTADSPFNILRFGRSDHRVLLLLVLLPGRSLSQAEEPRIRINSITLKGNRVTKERIIIRELVCAEGDTVSSEEMYERFERSRQNLMNTGLFNTVSVLPFYTGRYEVTVEVVVNERWYLWPSIIFDLADPNFNTWWLTKDFSV